MRSPSSLANAGTDPDGMARRLAGDLVVGDAGRLDGPTDRGRHHGVEQAHPLLGRQLGGHGLAGGVGQADGQLGGDPGAGFGGPDGRLDGLEHPPVVQRVRDAGQPLLAQGGGALVERLLQRLGHGARLIVQDHGPRRGHDGPQLAQAVVLARRLRHRSAVLPIRQPDCGQELLGHGHEGVSRHGGFAGRFGRGVLRFDGLPHGLQAAAEELLGHGDLFGP